MTQTTAATESTCIGRALYIAIDMGRDSWQLAISDGSKARRDVSIDRRDLQAGKAAMLAEIGKARTRFSLTDDAPVHALYEAGRDGFWLARWLGRQGVQCIIIDPASILVDRRAKQRKNDSIDARALLDLLVRHVTGDRVVRTVEVPPVEIEDARELGRLLRTLHKSRRAMAKRVQSRLWALGIDRSYHSHLPEEFDDMRTGDDRPLDVVIRCELDTLCKQLASLDADICKLEDQRERQVTKPQTPVQQQAHDLHKLFGIGLIGSWTLAHELFGWRHFDNAKKVAGFVGLAPTPFCSGTMERDLGISKAGPGPLRALLVQLAWDWLRYQPDSELSQWFHERFGDSGKRARRVGIVAVARKLLVLLWRYVMHGVVPAGARFKPDGHRPTRVRPKGYRMPRRLPAAA